MHLIYPRCRAYGQELLAALNFFEYHVLDHLALSYMVPQVAEDHTENADTPTSERRFTAPGKFNVKTSVLVRLPIDFHTSIVSSLRTFASCEHSSNHSACAECKERLVSDCLRVQNANPTLYRFCTLLASSAEIPSLFLKNMANSGAEILEIHTEEARAYFSRLDDQLNDPCKAYFDKFGTFSANAVEADSSAGDHEISGMVFPGRSHFRDDITFQETEKSSCEKNYLKSQNFSPGIMTVQCCCDKPVLLGYIVMTKPESRSLALTSIMTSFRIPPRVVYYDNACNLMQSILVRLPWVLHCTRFIVDRFHYKSHVCSEFFDPDVYRLLDADRTTTAEAINAKLERVVPFLRFVSGRNLVPHLSIRFALLNIATRFRFETGIEELEDEDLWGYFKEEIECACSCCENEGVSAIESRDEHRYGIAPVNYETDDDLEVIEFDAAAPPPSNADNPSDGEPIDQA